VRLGRFCVDCGQDLGAHDGSLRHFAHELVHEVAHVDTRILGSLRLLVLRPGFLTAEYFAGRRARYLRPLQTFAIINLLFFLVGPSVGLFAYPLHADAQGRFFAGDWREGIAAAKLARSGDTPADFTRHFAEHEGHWRKGLVFLMVPPFAAMAMRLQRRPRRSYADHLVFALHFYSFFLVALIAIGLVALAVAGISTRLGHPVHRVGDLVLGPALAAACWLYLTIAVRRAYGTRRLWATAQGLLLTATSVGLVPLYAMAVMTATLLAT
jgi:hypothetical protein